MICEAAIATRRRADGTTSISKLAGSPPITLMPTPDGVHIVGSAAGPLNGDRIALDIYVAPGTRLTIRSVAASLVWPGSSPVPSQFTIRARVASGAALEWLPEPLVPIAGSRHRVAADIDLAADARLVWREEIVLGRHRERPGELSSLIAIDRGGTPVLRQELSVGDDTHTSALLLGRSRAAGSLTVVDPSFATERPALEGFPSCGDDHDAALLELEAPARQVVVAAATAARLKSLLDSAARSVSPAKSSIATSKDHAPAHN